MGKPNLSLYIGRVVTDVCYDPEDKTKWWLELEGGVRIANKSPKEMFPPDKSIIGARLSFVSMSLRDTTLKFDAVNGYIHSISFKPTYYVIHDPAHGGEVYPQWPEELERAGIPATPEGGISDEPAPEWAEQEELLKISQEARVQKGAAEFLKEEE